MEFLKATPSHLDPWGSYLFLAKICLSQIRDGKPKTTISEYLSLSRKILLWSFLIREKPIRVLSPSDLQEFLRFCLDPPKDWVSKSRNIARFTRNDGALCINEKWRPFIETSGVRSERHVISFCWDLIGILHGPSQRVDFRSIIRELSCSHPLTPSEVPGECLDGLAVDLIDYYVGKITTDGSCKFSLLAFSTCYYFRISLSKLASDLDLIRRGYFERIQSGGWQLVYLDLRGGLVRLEAPEAYMELIIRYLDISAKSEVGVRIYTERLLVSQRIINPKLNTLRGWLKPPEDYPLAISPMTLISKSIRFSGPPPKVDDKRVRARVMPTGSIIERFKNSEKAASEDPFPIFFIDYKGKGFGIMKGAMKEIISRSKTDLEDISFLLDLPVRHKERAERNGFRPLRAIEKLILWQLLVCRKRFHDLDESDVMDFFRFCVFPPSNWVTGDSHRRTIKTKKGSRYIRVNVEWKPFIIKSGSIRNGEIEARELLDSCVEMLNGIPRRENEAFAIVLARLKSKKYGRWFDR
ncbi:hypothetical protein ACNFIA_31525 [Pseudomonas sp. NY15437]|uniref:hypothetical protein n=1 Tax=Pseudomonas sp. NY15437 TaxID=3400360 RepID=UPI003A842D7A